MKGNEVVVTQACGVRHSSLPLFKPVGGYRYIYADPRSTLGWLTIVHQALTWGGFRGNKAPWRDR